jgi:hypothetical protein
VTFNEEPLRAPASCASIQAACLGVPSALSVEATRRAEAEDAGGARDDKLLAPAIWCLSHSL